MLEWPFEPASAFDLLDEGKGVGFHLLLSVEKTDVLTNELVLCIVPVDCRPSCIDEQNGSVEIEHGNCLGCLFSDVCQTPQRSLDALMRGNYILHCNRPSGDHRYHYDYN
ncbi:hypothetical protein ES703_84996 [subsurface metagenome]